MKNLNHKIRTLLDTQVRDLCGRIPEAKRLTFVSLILLILAGLWIGIACAALCRIGREDAGRNIPRITPITVPDFGSESPSTSEEEVPVNRQPYGYEDE